MVGHPCRSFRNRSHLIALAVLLHAAVCGARAAAPAADYASHPPLRPPAEPSTRPMPGGPFYIVDAQRGNDANPGTEAKPWQTINHALAQLSAGDTLLLRGGAYFENVYCAVKGEPDAPITIRSYPGELAVIDGGMPEFQEAPDAAWQECPNGTPGEFISTRTYKNIRDITGLFGDSNNGLQTYWYRMDLQATNEWIIEDAETMWKPVWAGPGLWYDKDTGRIHCRLAHTHIDLPPEAGHEIVNYRGETDPRRLPLVVAPFNSTPLTVDQAMHVRFQDLVVRGGGYITVDLVFGVDLVFENCLIYCGTYGIWSKNTGPFTMTDCGVYGNMQPWAFRSDTALYSYDGRVYPPFVGGSKVEPEKGTSSGKIKGKERVVRHLSRMSTHAVLVTEGFHEFEVFAHPFNHDWEISNCEFTDGHDGVYLSGRNIRFHHNWVANMNDDGLYLSSPTPFVTDKLYVYQNLISTVVAPFGTHGRGGPGGDIHVYRNVVDQRGPIQYVRPSPERPGGYIANGTLALLTHGSALHMEHMNFYHNTILQSVPHPRWWGGGLMGASANAARRVFNNIIVYYQSHYFDRTWEGYPKFALNAKEGDLQTDGNLHWHAEAGTNVPPDFLENVRTHPLSATNKAAYPPGWAANSLVADPGFVAFDRARTSANDYRLRKDSPAIGAGIILPGEFEDPLRPAGDKRPDIGAMPLGSEPLRVGINGRITAGTVEGLGHFRRPE